MSDDAAKLRTIAARHRELYGNDAPEAADLDALADAITNKAATVEQLLVATDAAIRLLSIQPPTLDGDVT